MVGATTYECTFGSSNTINGDGRNSTDTDNGGFFVFTRGNSSNNKSNQGTVEYNGQSLSYCFALESNAKISFTTDEDNMVLTMIWGSSSTHANIYIDSENSNIQTGDAVYDDDGETVLYYKLTYILENSGEHTLYDYQSGYLFYISVASADEEGDDNTTDESTTALWDFENDNPSGILAAATYYESSDPGYINSTISNIKMYVNTNGSGKFVQDSGKNHVQINAGTTLQVPVLSTSDVVTVKTYDGYSVEYYTIGGDAVTTNPQTYTASQTDVDNGYVEIAQTTNGYLYSVSVEYAADDDIESIDFGSFELESVTPGPAIEGGEDANTVQTLAQIVVAASEAVSIVEDNIASIVVTNEDGEEVTTATSGYYKPSYDVDDETIIGATFVLESEITKAGTYTITIPENIMTNGDGCMSKEISQAVTVLGKSYELTCDPDPEGGEVELLNTLTISCEDGIAWSGNGTITIQKDSEEEYKFDTSGDDVVENIYTSDDYDDPATAVDIHLNIAEAGTYTIKISEGAFNLGDDDSGDTSDAIELTYTVKGISISNSSEEDTNYPTTVENNTSVSISTGIDTEVTVKMIISDEEGNEVAQGTFTYDEATQTYTWTYSSEYGDLYKDTQYTFTVNVYASDDDTNVLYTEELFTATGTEEWPYSTVTLESYSPDPDEDDLSVEETTITLNYSDDVIVTADIYMGNDEEPLEVAVSNSAEDATKADKTWYITIPEETMEQFANSNITVRFQAIADEDSKPVEGTSGEYSFFVYSVVESIDYTWTFTPADADKVDSLYSITIEANGPVTFNFDDFDVDNVYVYGSSITDTITKGDVSVYDGEEYDESGNLIGYTVMFEDTIVTAGDYKIYIPEKLFYCGADTYSGEGSPETTITVTVSGTATGIKGVTLQATGDDKFYNLNGQRVTSPRNG
ncbi:MAG: hypothetical protein LUC24_05130, partial [Bacteroidales bacterium]|nr:hypothetical protein [Bacteroidales bacterium]